MRQPPQKQVTFNGTLYIASATLLQLVQNVVQTVHPADSIASNAQA